MQLTPVCKLLDGVQVFTVKLFLPANSLWLCCGILATLNLFWFGPDCSWKTWPWNWLFPCFRIRFHHMPAQCTHSWLHGVLVVLFAPSILASAALSGLTMQREAPAKTSEVLRSVKSQPRCNTESKSVSLRCTMSTGQLLGLYMIFQSMVSKQLSMPLTEWAPLFPRHCHEGISLVPKLFQILSPSKMHLWGLGVVGHTYNFSYSGGRDSDWDSGKKLMRLHLKSISQTWWYMPVIPPTQVVELGGSQSRLIQAKHKTLSENN
jgi:hypothetical protein